jgi:hypothetical protein
MEASISSTCFGVDIVISASHSSEVWMFVVLIDDKFEMISVILQDRTFVSITSESEVGKFS